MSAPSTTLPWVGRIFLLLCRQGPLLAWRFGQLCHDLCRDKGRDNRGAFVGADGGPDGADQAVRGGGGSLCGTEPFEFFAFGM